MTDAAAEILRELRELRRMVERLAPPLLLPAQARVVELLGDLYGTAPFRTCELWRRLGVPIAPGPELLRTLADLGGSNAQTAGQALALIARRGGQAGQWRLVRPKGESGRALWALERAREG